MAIGAIVDCIANHLMSGDAAFSPLRAYLILADTRRQEGLLGLIEHKRSGLLGGCKVMAAVLNIKCYYGCIGGNLNASDAINPQGAILGRGGGAKSQSRQA
jgi:hypothetical protein